MSDGNFLPFRTILSYLMGEPTWGIAFRNLLGNVALFIPLGLLTPFLWGTAFSRKLLLVMFGVPLIVEGLQALLRSGVVDVDDVLLNAFGIMTGRLLVLLAHRLCAPVQAPGTEQKNPPCMRGRSL